LAITMAFLLCYSPQELIGSIVPDFRSNIKPATEQVQLQTLSGTPIRLCVI